MSHYDNYKYATKRMDVMQKCIDFYREAIAKCEEKYLEYEADATIAYNAMEKAGTLQSTTKTNEE